MKIRIAIFILLPVLRSSAQNTPLFQAAFYFTDAKGHQDSCTVGFDPEATDTMDVQFEEVAIRAPFDSVFEVRVTHLEGLWTLDKENMSKKSITGGGYFIFDPPPYDACYTGWHTVFLVKAKYPPVTVSWDRNTFRQNLCVSASAMLLNKKLFLTESPYYIDKPFMACLAVDSTYLYDERVFPRDVEFYFGLNYPSAGIPNDTIMGFCIIYSSIYGSTPTVCVDSASIFVTTHQIYSSPNTARVRLWPNPGNGRVQVSAPEGVWFDGWALYSRTGQLVQQEEAPGRRWSSTTIAIDALPPGLYLLRLHTPDGQWVCSRFVKA